MSNPPLNPWEQQPDEPDKAFTAFTKYLYLGPSRSLRALATKGNKRQQEVSGSIGRLSAEWNWPARALAWDRHNVAAHGEAAALAFVATLERLAMLALQALDDKRTEPKTPAQVLEIVKVLSPYISADLIQRVSSGGPRPT